mmetsp:Transcript_104881/g.146224  ORF Transcript_104881/g.146224 Transcript_104881/m.146224 type:complete len:204 (+) Transcript_104881:450-1061(+)
MLSPPRWMVVRTGSVNLEKWQTSLELGETSWELPSTKSGSSSLSSLAQTISAGPVLVMGAMQLVRLPATTKTKWQLHWTSSIRTLQGPLWPLFSQWTPLVCSQSNLVSVPPCMVLSVAVAPVMMRAGVLTSANTLLSTIRFWKKSLQSTMMRMSLQQSSNPSLWTLTHQRSLMAAMIRATLHLIASISLLRLMPKLVWPCGTT